MKELTNKSVECIASSANPADSVTMAFSVDGIKLKYTELHVIQTPFSDGGENKTFVFTFTTDRSQNGKTAQCRLKWDYTYIQKQAEASFNITCE